MAVSPPKCRTCGKAEWRHICGGLPESIVRPLTKPVEAPKSKTDRKEYLKLKARERRARQKAAKA